MSSTLERSFSLIAFSFCPLSPEPTTTFSSTGYPTDGASEDPQRARNSGVNLDIRECQAFTLGYEVIAGVGTNASKAALSCPEGL